jgi:hypothetical protein
MKNLKNAEPASAMPVLKLVAKKNIKSKIRLDNG